MAIGLLAFSCATPMSRAEEGKTLIRLVPKPNTVFRFEAAQHMEMDITAEGMPQTQGPVLRKLVTDYLFGFTERTGRLTEEGNVDAEITYDKISLTQTMDGKPMPVLSMDKELEGKVITFTFDRNGRVVGTRLPDGTAASGETLKEMMNSFFGSLPSGPMSIGETTSTPYSMPLPLPAPGPDPLTVTGQTRYQLLSLAADGADTLATLKQVVDASLARMLELPLPGGKATVEIGFKVSGAGEVVLNLGKGVMRSSGMQLTLDGRMVTTFDTADTPPQTLKLHGVARMKSTGSY